MKEKKIMVMTSFGPVPFEAIKEYIPKESLNDAEIAAKKALTILNPCNIEFYIDRIAVRKHWDYKKVYSYIQNLFKFSNMAALNILLREIAVYLDSKYSDSINKSEEIYIISSISGKISKVNKKYIKNYRNFAAFRTHDDAMFAYNVLKDMIRYMFHE